MEKSKTYDLSPDTVPFDVAMGGSVYCCHCGVENRIDALYCYRCGKNPKLTVDILIDLIKDNQINLDRPIIGGMSLMSFPLSVFLELESKTHSPESQFLLFSYYYDGCDDDSDEELQKALDYLLKAVEQNLEEAICEWHQFLCDGCETNEYIYVQKDSRKAMLFAKSKQHIGKRIREIYEHDYIRERNKAVDRMHARGATDAHFPFDAELETKLKDKLKPL